MHEDFSRKVEIKLSSDHTFGLVFGGFFAVIGLFPLLRGGGMRLWALGLSTVFLVLSAAMPSVLHPLNLGAAKLAAVMHRIVSPVVLGLLFFAGFTPIALISRLFRKDPLRLKYDSQAETYWVNRESPGPAPETMRNQF